MVFRLHLSVLLPCEWWGRRFLNHSNIEAVLIKRQPGDSPRTPKPNLIKALPAKAVESQRVMFCHLFKLYDSNHFPRTEDGLELRVRSLLSKSTRMKAVLEADMGSIPFFTYLKYLLRVVYIPSRFVMEEIFLN